MIKSNVILILKTLSDKEVSLFEDFLNSPFHNKNTKVIRLFNTLREYHPGYNDEKLSKVKLFKGLFGSVKYKESYIRNLFSDLNILAESFLQYVHITNNYIGERFLIEELNNRDVSEVMAKKIRLFEKKINSQKSRDEDYYINRIFIYDMKSFLMVDKTLTESYRPDEILSKIKLLLISLMTSSFYLIVEEQRVKIRHNFGFLKHTLEYLRDHLTEFEDSPLLLTYYYLSLCFFDKNDEKYFLKAKKLFRSHFSSYSKLDKKNIYSVMQTYCMNKIDMGSKSYSKELLNILLEMLKFKILSHKEKDLINLNLYRNVMILSFSLNEINVLKKFIPEYINFVDSESRNSMLAYSYAHLNFLQRNFEKALELCNEINFNDLLVTTNDNLYFKKDIKKLILICLYELNYFESAISLIDATKHFLNSSRLKEESKKKEMNFLNLVNDLIKLRNKFDDFKLVKFKEKVLNTEGLAGRDWLLEKIGDIRKETSNSRN